MGGNSVKKLNHSHLLFQNQDTDLLWIHGLHGCWQPLKKVFAMEASIESCASYMLSTIHPYFQFCLSFQGCHQALNK